MLNGGLPIHIDAKLLGRLDLQTTQGDVAVFEEDLIHYYQDFLARRRSRRPIDEYPQPGEVEWAEFESEPRSRAPESPAPDGSRVPSPATSGPDTRPDGRQKSPKSPPEPVITDCFEPVRRG